MTLMEPGSYARKHTTKESKVPSMQKNVQKLLSFFRDWKNQKVYLKWMFAHIRPFLSVFLLLLLINGCASLLGVFQTVAAKNLIDGAAGVFQSAPPEATPSMSTSPAVTPPAVALPEQAPQTAALPMASLTEIPPSAFPQPSGLLLLAATLLFSIALHAALDYLSTIVHERYSFAVRLRAFDQVLQSEWEWVASYHSGDVVARLTGDVDTFATGTASMIPDLFLLIFRLVSAFAVLYYYDHVLAVTALLLGPAGALLSLLLSDKLKKVQMALKETESKSLALMQETVSNIAVVKAFSWEEKSIAWLSGIRDERMRLVKLRSKRNIAINLGMQIVFAMGYLTAFAWGIYRLQAGSITFGTMSVFLSLAMQIQGPIMSLAKMIPQFINVLASAGRVMEIDGQTPEPHAEEKVTPVHVGIRMHDVCFSYHEELILKNVCLDIRPGDRIGVIGYSGAGKTTLIRLILGFIHPGRPGREPKEPGQALGEPGHVLFYNDLGEEEPASRSARRLVAYVPQGNSLQSGTILENLAGGKDISMAEIWEALTIADAVDFVKSLPEGLDTRIGERAGGLSEGQAQRIAIARAILKDAPVIILDEATSALDEKTEAAVLQRLSGSGKMKTCIIITHRRGMLAYCNRAFEIANAEVLEIDIGKSGGNEWRKKPITNVEAPEINAEKQVT